MPLPNARPLSHLNVNVKPFSDEVFLEDTLMISPQNLDELSIFGELPCLRRLE